MSLDFIWIEDLITVNLQSCIFASFKFSGVQLSQSNRVSKDAGFRTHEPKFPRGQTARSPIVRIFYRWKHSNVSGIGGHGSLKNRHLGLILRLLEYFLRKAILAVVYVVTFGGANNSFDLLGSVPF